MIGEMLSCGYCDSDAVIDRFINLDNGVSVGSAPCRCGREVLTVRCPDGIPLEFMDRFLALLDFEIERRSALLGRQDAVLNPFASSRMNAKLFQAIGARVVG
jgi:hypothetical protein